jgi:hypothetical protein
MNDSTCLGQHANHGKINEPMLEREGYSNPDALLERMKHISRSISEVSYSSYIRMDTASYVFPPNF